MKIYKKKKSVDLQLKEFEEKDLGNDIRKSKSAVLIKPKQFATSVLLNRGLIYLLKQKAQKRGIGYQTMLKIIVAENVARY